MAPMDSGLETSSNDSDFNDKKNINVNNDHSKAALKNEFISLLEKNSIQEYKQLCQTSTSYIQLPHTSSTTSSALSHNFKMKTKPYRTFETILSLRAMKNKKLVFATMTNNVELVTELLKSMKVDPNFADEFKRTPLHLAATRGYVHIVNLLIFYGANPNSRDSLGNTPLHLAACVCKKPIVQALLDGGANVNILDRNKHTPYDLVYSKYQSRVNTCKSYDYYDVLFLLKSKYQPEDEMKALFDNLSITNNNHNNNNNNNQSM